MTTTTLNNINATKNGNSWSYTIPANYIKHGTINIQKPATIIIIQQ